MHLWRLGLVLGVATLTTQSINAQQPFFRTDQRLVWPDSLIRAMTAQQLADIVELK